MGNPCLRPTASHLAARELTVTSSRRPEASTVACPPTSLASVDAVHAALIPRLGKNARKAAALELIGHLEALPDLGSLPGALFYHVDTASHLVDMILQPVPISSSVPFLTVLLEALMRVPRRSRLTSPVSRMPSRGYRSCWPWSVPSAGTRGRG